MRVVITSDVDVLELDDGYTKRRDVPWLLKDGIDGWYNTPGLKSDVVDRPNGDGAYRPNFLWQSKRVVTIDGAVVPRSSASEIGFHDRINDLVGRHLTLQVHDSSGVRQAQCHVQDDTSIIVRADSYVMRFTIILCCPDPLRYSPPVVYHAAGGSVRVENAGNMPTWPSIHVTGPASSLTLGLNGRKLTWNGTAPDGVDIDTRDMIASVGTLGSEDGFMIPPGQSTATASGTYRGVALSVRSAWR
ncbi:hypothetical protein Uis1B_0624 [Bifidobacterium margollesii]|uniref:Uncharacterized protein n=1 Tax=Bifidobacterium margollesii TaxID=2020964 RepID=A0A2N5JBP4_9BIFI|nr:hypothetical protein [Bifidobacterium margollesii]PLS31632.1 hypothetical protein Uis1B_0624 [Bifidobacterium margollesii]